MVTARKIRRTRVGLLAMGSLFASCETPDPAAEDIQTAAVTSPSKPLQGGDLLWTKMGQFLVGKNRDIYRIDINEGQNTSLVARLSPDGATKWERHFAGIDIRIQSNCIFSDSLVLEQTGIIQALDLATGKEKWSFNPNAGAVGSGLVASAYCFAPASEYIAVVAGRIKAASLTLVKRSSGKVQWKLTNLPSFPYPSAVFAKYLVAYSTGAGNDALTLSAYILGAPMPIIAHKLRLPGDSFLVGGGAVERLYACYRKPGDATYTLGRIEPSTLAIGNERALQDDQYPSIDAWRLRLDGPNSIEWVDMTTLDTVWSYEAPASLAYTYAALASGKYMMSYNTSTTTAALAYLDPSAKVNPVWVRTCPTVPCFASSDPKGGVYLTDQWTLHALNLANGTNLWTYDAPKKPSDYLDGAQGGVEEVVDVDAKGYYVTYRGPGYECPPMGIAAVVPSNTIGGRARVRWDDYHDYNVSLLTSDHANLYAFITPCSSFGSLAAIRK